MKKIGFIMGFAALVAAKTIYAETLDGGRELSGIPVTVVGDDVFVTKWLALGPFPSPEPKSKDPGIRGSGFDYDFLASLGGEANARVTTETTVTGESGGVAWTATAKPFSLEDVAQAPDATQDLRELFAPGATEDKNLFAYAFADLKSDEERRMVCRFRWGLAHCSNVWLNGQLVHPTAASRELGGRRAQFPVTFKPGLNRLTVKIEHRFWAWYPNLEFLDEERAAASERVERFLRDDTLQVKTMFNGRLVKTGGKLPGVEFEYPEFTERLIDNGTLAVRWFDADFNEVTVAAKPGFYCGYVTAQSSQPFQSSQNSQPLPWRRVVPLMVFDEPDRWVFPWDFTNKELTAWREGEFTPAAWEAGRLLMTNALLDGWLRVASSDLAPLWMGEMTFDRAPADAWREAPYAHLQDYMVRLRHKVLDRPAPRTLAPPTAEPTAAALREGTEAEASFKPGAVEKIRASLAEWCEKSGHGFVAVVARRGVVVLHEAYTGEKDTVRGNMPWGLCPPDQLTDGKMTVSSRLENASTTKLFAGVLLGRCIDQGLVRLDDPVNKYFPDFPTEGPLATLTVRRLMNHTNGLDGHRSWPGLEGMVNPFMDIAALWHLQNDASGLARYNYNGFGIDLGGKVVEDVTGQSAFRVMRDGLFEPLGMEGASIRDLAYGLQCTAMDLARMAEMLRLGGAYGGKRYMRPETLESLLPIPVAAHAPEMDSAVSTEYGIGIQWMREPDFPAWQKERTYILGENVFGHGSATGAILRVARDHDLIVTMVRYTQGPDYDLHKDKFLQAIADGLPDNE